MHEYGTVRLSTDTAYINGKLSACQVHGIRFVHCFAFSFSDCCFYGDTETSDKTAEPALTALPAYQKSRLVLRNVNLFSIAYLLLNCYLLLKKSVAAHGRRQEENCRILTAADPKRLVCGLSVRVSVNSGKKLPAKAQFPVFCGQHLRQNADSRRSYFLKPSSSMILR